jgi:hypothetical protein
MHNFLNVTTPYIYTQRDLVSSCHQKKLAGAMHGDGVDRHSIMICLFCSLARPPARGGN